MQVDIALARRPFIFVYANALLSWYCRLCLLGRLGFHGVADGITTYLQTQPSLPK